MMKSNLGGIILCQTDSLVTIAAAGYLFCLLSSSAAVETASVAAATTAVVVATTTVAAAVTTAVDAATIAAKHIRCFNQ